MKDKLVTLIGGGGFIGRYVAQELLAGGARIRVVERDPRRAWFLKTQGGLGQVQFAAADVTKPETIARAVAGSDAVVYLVGTWGPNFDGIHVDGVRAAADAATATGATRFVLVSAMGANAGSPARYLASKGRGEVAALAGFPAATILRPSVVFGPEDKFLNRFAAMITSLPVVPVLHAQAKFQPVHVVDVAKAVAAAIADPVHQGKTFELGGPEVVTMGELIRWLAQALGRDPRILELPDAIGRAIAAVGFLPGAPITLDQWRMLQVDNMASGTLPTTTALGITSTPMESAAPAWLVRYRKAGRFGLRANVA